MIITVKKNITKWYHVYRSIFIVVEIFEMKIINLIEYPCMIKIIRLKPSSFPHPPRFRGRVVLFCLCWQSWLLAVRRSQSVCHSTKWVSLLVILSHFFQRGAIHMYTNYTCTKPAYRKKLSQSKLTKIWPFKVIYKNTEVIISKYYKLFISWLLRSGPP